MTRVSSHADYKTTDYRFPRQREDWRHVEFERSPTIWMTWGQHIAAAIGIVLLGSLAFPVAEFISELMARSP